MAGPGSEAWAGEGDPCDGMAGRASSLGAGGGMRGVMDFLVRVRLDCLYAGGLDRGTVPCGLVHGLPGG